MKTVATFPHIGFYTPVFANLIRKLNTQVIAPGDISEGIVKKGVRHSPEMVCYPFKISLGSIMESLDKGANTIVYFDSCGQCRFRHYWIMQKHILEELGYKFKIIPLRARTIVLDLKKINPGNSYLKVLKAMKGTWDEINMVEGMRDEFNPTINRDDINVLVFGEIYTVLEYAINLNVVEKLRKMGARPKMAVSLSHFIGEPVRLRPRPEYLENAKKYINGPIGGHGLQSIAHTMHAAKHGYDGVMHIEPLSCMPETMVEPVINSICEKKGLALLRLAIDETNSEANLDTRLETFIEIMRRKKYAACVVGR